VLRDILPGRVKGVTSKAGTGLPARQAAVQLLSSVLKDRRSLDETLGRYSERGPLQHLSHRDRAFARAIVAISLRRLGQIEDVLRHFLEKPLPKKSGTTREILIAGVAQLLFLETQPHAAIDLSVRLCQRDRRAKRFDKLTNAVLRRVADRGAAIIAEQDAERLNTPDWLWQRWTNFYGEEAAQAIAYAHLGEAPLDLTVKSEPGAWAERLGGVMLPTGTVRIKHKGRIESIEGFETGDWWVQDAAAALPARLLGPLKGSRVADLCAAPGGKTAQLAHAGAHVVAVDISPVRLDRLKENLNRLNLAAEIVEENVLDWRPQEPFDAILLDVPCSATGTIRRHPDIPHLKGPDDIAELAEAQARLLRHALGLLKPEGTLMYCSCSLEPEEGINQIAALFDETPGLRLQPVGAAEVGGQHDLIDQGCLRSFPFQLRTADAEMSGIDGFFAARIRYA